MSRVWSALTAALCIGIVTMPTGAHAAAHKSGSLRHIVVMTQGGRSFDNYFGAVRGVNGFSQVPCQLQAAGDQLGCIGPHPITRATQPAALRTGAATQRASVNGGQMDGFVRAQSGAQSDGTAAMGYYRPTSLPLLREVVSRGVLFDNWFSGVPGGTLPNDLFDMTARPPGDAPIIPNRGWPTQPVIFDRLNDAGVSWRVYVQNYEPALTIRTAATKQRLGGQLARVPLLAMPRYLDDPALLSHVVDLDHYYRDLDSGNLPAVSYVVSTSATEQAPRDPEKGHQLIRSILNGLLASSAWPSSALLVQWDSSGGWYDHVQPPTLDGASTGLRVPAVLISPFAHGGTVDHSRFDSAATLKLIESTFGVRPLAARDRNAGDLRTALSFGLKPRAPALVGVSTDRPVVQPNRVPLVVGYVVALSVAVSAGAFALLRSERDRRHQTELPA